MASNIYKVKQKPGPKPGSTHVDENERRLTKSFTLPRWQIEKLNEEKNASRLVEKLLRVYYQ